MAKDPSGKDAVDVRQAAGENSTSAQLKAGSELQHAKDKAQSAGYRARHEGNRANWSK